ncbi:MAG: hypothetical protein WAW41_04785, partial [Methylobacter sp.]
IEGVGFAIIENQNDRLITSSKLYFQALLSAIALSQNLVPVDLVGFIVPTLRRGNSVCNAPALRDIVSQTFLVFKTWKVCISACF